MKYITAHILFLIPLLLLSLVIPQHSLAQITDPSDTEDGTRGAPRVYKYDTRTTAMGDATVSDLTNLSAININPATLSFVRDFRQVQVTVFQNWNNNLMYENGTFPVLSYNQHRVAAQVARHHNGINATNPLSEVPHPEPNIALYQVDIAYAYSFENLLSLGFLNSSTLSRNEDAQYWTNFTTLGLLYSPSQVVSYGAAFRGLGRSVVYSIAGENSTIFSSQDLRESLELGATIKFPSKSDHYYSLSLANEKRFGENGIWYKLGLEVKPFTALALRSGFVLHPENNVFAPRFGFGIDTDFIEVEYAISYNDKLYERFHQIGISFNLN